VLLAIGLLLILFTLYQSYYIFIGVFSPPLLFKEPAPLASQKIGAPANMQDLQKQLNQDMVALVGQMIPVGALPKALNLISWSILAGILIFGGGQIAGIGVKLIKHG